jgi:hypothetical protein
MEILNKRNTETLQGEVKRLYELAYAQQEQLVAQNLAFISLQERLTKLEQQLIIQKVQLTGLGPSVKE